MAHDKASRSKIGPFETLARMPSGVGMKRTGKIVLYALALLAGGWLVMYFFPGTFPY